MYREEVGRVPGLAQGDITRVEMRYGAHALVVRVEVRDLHPEHYSYLGVTLKLPGRQAGDPNRSLYSEYSFSLSHGDDVGIADPSTGYLVSCRPVVGTKSYRHGWLRLVVPRGCLRNAGWVRAGVYFREARRDAQGNPFIATDTGTQKGVRPGHQYSPQLTVG